jgi:nicotinamidase-related amidase
MRRREFTSLAFAGAVGAVGVPKAVKAQTTLGGKATKWAKATRRIDIDHCCGAIIDVQEYFLAQLDGYRRSEIVLHTTDFARLLGRFKIPLVVTLEKPVDQKGSLPPEIHAELGDLATTFEKTFFDLSREKPISDHLAGLNKKQVIVVGCETDVCVLQSCLGLLSHGYEVYMVEDLLFTSSPDVAAAMARMKAEGAIFLTYKTLFYELTAMVENEESRERYGTALR